MAKNSIGIHFLRLNQESIPGLTTFLNVIEILTAAWLAQLVGRQSAVREVEGSSPRSDQHSGS